MKRIAIASTQPDLHFYTDMLNQCHMDFMLVRTVSELEPLCDALLLPGGGDPDPTLFHSANQGSRDIRLSEDLLQLIALDYYTEKKLPVLGICKGMQMINIYFGGTLHQDLPAPSIHQRPSTASAAPASSGSQPQTLPQTLVHHVCYQKEGSIMEALYGPAIITNSNHHQALEQIGHELEVIQRAGDSCPEAVIHTSLPVLGVQWHPERMPGARPGIRQADLRSHTPYAQKKTDRTPVHADGDLLFRFFISLI